MLDPDGVCGVDVAETVSCRSLATHCSSLFANVAGELICQWTEGDDDPNIYFPTADVKEVIEELEQKVGEDMKDDLNKLSDYSVAPSDNEVPGSKAFQCLRPLSEDETGKLKVDDENVVKCPFHDPQRNLVDCVYCHARQQQLVERADVLCRQAEKKTDVRSVSKVFCPLRTAKHIPMEIWKSPNAKESAEGWPVPKMVGIERLRMEIPSPDTPLARWRINLRGCLSYTILVTCPDVMSRHVNKDWTDMQCIEMLERLQDEDEAPWRHDSCECSQWRSLTSRQAHWTRVKKPVSPWRRASILCHPLTKTWNRGDSGQNCPAHSSSENGKSSS